MRLEGTPGHHLFLPIWSLPMLKQSPLQQVTQGHFQLGFEYPLRRRLHKNSGQPVPVFDDICSNKQINPSYVLIGLPMFQFVPIDSCTFTENQRKKWLHLYSYSECIINTGKIPVSLLFCRLSPSLSSYYRCTSPLIFL